MECIKLFNQGYDKYFLENKHYQKHPQMLPYVGEDYEKYKLLIVSESHYVPSSFKDVVGQEWYTSISAETVSKMEGYTHTRQVINQHFKNKGHRLFSNLDSAIKNVDKDLSLKNVAWYNFYQRPAKHKTEIKNLKKTDRNIALDVFEHNLSVLRPQVVIFVSKNAFSSLHFDESGKKVKGMRKWSAELGGHQYKDIQTPLQNTTHPNSSWWNRKHGKLKETGRERFERILRIYIH